MKISYNWLKDFLPLDMSPLEVGDLLTSIGLEVESITQLGPRAGLLESLTIGQVIACSKHPNADKLSLTQVDIGLAEPLHIVCGAPNVATGQKVIVATVGTTLYPSTGEPFTIKLSKIRGEQSQGMLCAEDEIGLSDDHAGIKILPEDSPIGASLATILKPNSDSIFEIGLTPNRSDAFSHIGVARDLASVINVRYGRNIKVTEPTLLAESVLPRHNPIQVSLENTTACPRYSGVVIENLKVEESPLWLQERLKSVGLRPINNVVDITNFVMLETGQPLHAFDADKIIGSKVIVKNLPSNTEFLTLDGTTKKLHQEDIVICNSEQPMCMGGVFGGLSSGVTNDTTSIFLESAHFDAITIRKTAQRHQLRTDAAQRFEKGVDPNGTEYALRRAAHLFQTIMGAKIASAITDIYPNVMEQPHVNLRFDRVNKVAGQAISPEQVKTILNALDIQLLSENGQGLELLVPTNKVDVTREIDVIEEILRIYGMDNIQIPTLIKSSISYAGTRDEQGFIDHISNMLTGVGYSEMMNTSLTQSKYYEGQAQQPIKLLSNANAQLDILRTNLLYGSLETVRHNLNRKQSNLRLFEWGYCYTKNTANKYEEDFQLLLIQVGQESPQQWRQLRNSDFYDLKSQVEKILTRSAIQGYTTKETENADLEYGLDYVYNKKKIATIGLVSKKTTEQFNVDQQVYVAILEIDELLKQWLVATIQFKPIPKYPAVERDLAMILDQSLQYETLKNAVLSLKLPLLRDIQLFDVYVDKKLGEGKKSYAINFELRDDDKTLTDKEIEEAMAKIAHCLTSEVGVSIRGI